MRRICTRCFPFLATVLILFLVVVGMDPTYAQDESEYTIYLPLVSTQQTATSEFEQLSQDLAQMEGFFSGGNGALVSFDEAAARAGGFGEESIVLARELTAHTNDLIVAAQEAQNARTSPDKDIFDVSVDAYPSLKTYFALATAQSNAGEGGGAETSGWCKWYLSDRACSCGHWSYPRPTSAAPWRNWSTANSANTLRSWGYHETPGWAGGGWTRSQTYYPSRCGNNTFRDHAYILSSQNFREQTYAGYTPRGEPNPEFWRGGPWPYAAWPSYVRWWHDNH